MTVHWWRTEKLVDDLIADRVTELQTMWYAIAGGALYTQAVYYAMWFGGYRTWMLLYELAVVMTIAVIGVRECFKANGASAGRDFLKRLCCISVPVGIKIAIVSLLAYQVLYYGFPRVVTHEVVRDPASVYPLAVFALNVTIAVLYYWRIYVHLTQVSLGSVLTRA